MDNNGSNGSPDSICVLSKIERCPTGRLSSLCQSCISKQELICEGMTNVTRTEEDILHLLQDVLIEMEDRVENSMLEETIKVFKRIIDAGDPILMDSISLIAKTVETEKERVKINTLLIL